MKRVLLTPVHAPLARHAPNAAQMAINEKYRTYEEMAGWAASRFHPQKPALM